MIEKAAGAALAAAVLVLLAGWATGHMLFGLALAIGLALGSVNGYLAKRGFHSEAGFRMTSLMRLGGLTAAGLVSGLLLGLPTVPFVIGGIAVAQLLLSAVAAHHLVQA